MYARVKTNQSMWESQVVGIAIGTTHNDVKSTLACMAATADAKTLSKRCNNQEKTGNPGVPFTSGMQPYGA
jgi:hypothetical protein